MIKLKCVDDSDIKISEFISEFDTMLYNIRQQLTEKQYDEITNKMMITILESKED